MSARASLGRFWDDLTRKWLDGGDPLPDPLPRWFNSYRGRGQGALTRETFAEPWIGPLLGTPRLVVLGLNPGQAHLRFQARDGLFAREIEDFGGYTAWAASTPYSRPPWTAAYKGTRYHDQRVTFARHFYGDRAIGAADVLTLELYPWHSTRVTGRMTAPLDALGPFLWNHSPSWTLPRCSPSVNPGHVSPASSAYHWSAISGQAASRWAT